MSNPTMAEIMSKKTAVTKSVDIQVNGAVATEIRTRITAR